jgi:hypothetical protein
MSEKDIVAFLTRRENEIRRDDPVMANDLCDARDEITRLRTENAELRGAFRDLQVTLSNRMTPGLNEVDYGACDTRVDIDYRVGLARTLLDKETTS